MSNAGDPRAGQNALVRVEPDGLGSTGLGVPALGRGARALALLAAHPAVRRVAFAGVAFGVGFQLSRMLKAGRLPGAASTARDVFQAAAGGDPVAEGRLAGRWVRETITVIVGMPGTRGGRGEG